MTTRLDWDAAAQHPGHVRVHVSRPAGAVANEDDEVSALENPLRLMPDSLLDGILRTWQKAPSIDQGEVKTTPLNLGEHAIPSHARLVVRDRLAPTSQTEPGDAK